MNRRPRGAAALTAALAAALFLGACSSEIFEGRKVDYKSAGKLPPLEIPPDLTRPGRDDRYQVPDTAGSGGAATTFSTYNAERGGARAGTSTAEVLPTMSQVSLQRDGNTRYLIVREAPEKVWPVVREFWQENGFLIKVELPEAGVMETDWAENRAKIPQDPIRNVLGKVLDQVYSTGERDKFRTRLERTQNGYTEVYVSHRGMVEQLVGDKYGSVGDRSMWEPRPPDPELEAEFLRRLMVKLGVEDEKAKAQVASRPANRDERAKIVTAKDGAAVLDVNEPFDRAWRRVGLALDRVGFTVEDRDRSKGIYFVRYADPGAEQKADPGFLSKLAFWRSTDTAKPAQQYQVVVNSGAEASQVRIYNKEGGPDATGASKKILGLLYDQLK